MSLISQWSSSKTNESQGSRLALFFAILGQTEAIMSQYLRNGCVVLLLAICIPVTYGSAFGQTNSNKDHNQCLSKIARNFRESTNYVWKGNGTSSHSELDFSENKNVKNGKWPLSDFDRINPAYQLIVDLKGKDIDPKKCGGTILLEGKLVTPFGEIFEFDEANYDLDKRIFTIRTKAHDGLIFYLRGEIFERPKSIVVNGGFSDGHLVLKAVGSKIGEVVLEFDFHSFQSVM